MGILKNPLARYFALMTAAYWAIAIYVPARMMIEIADGFAIAFAATVGWVYLGKTWVALSRRKVDVYDMLIVGICGGWITNSFDRMVRLYTRVSTDSTILDFYFIGYLLCCLSFFAGLHLMIRGSMSNGDMFTGVTPEAWRAFLFAFGVGAVISALAVLIDYDWLPHVAF